MNSQSYQAESSIGMNLRAQNNESLITSAKPTQEHRAQQTDYLHLDEHFLYTMIARLNAVFTQLVTEIQQHHLRQ